jgi:hypothetical protein
MFGNAVMRSVVLLLILISAQTYCEAQQRGVVVDMITHLPVSDATITTNTNKRVFTDNNGRFVIISQFSSITVSHINFLRRNMDIREIGDTIYLLPREVKVSEVIVTGKAPKITVPFKIMTGDYLTDPKGSSFGTFDFFAMFQRHKVSSKERKRRHDAIVNY